MRHRKVAACARVTGRSGPNDSGVSPVVTPASAAQSTAGVYQVPSGTSRNPLGAEAAGSPMNRHRKVTACARGRVTSGSKIPPPVPVETPVYLAQSEAATQKPSSASEKGSKSTRGGNRSSGYRGSRSSGSAVGRVTNAPVARINLRIRSTVN